ncbi:toxin-antitoxin system YwqK family antitoxin [Streptomyces sp. NPDC090046]|uniref:toxin-antitoxin system YwqK family antitoxin n=1 Tax=Streptomyces sp. NPDC090046 TaxID=3365928 RepID=UPI00382E2C04
MHRIDIDDPEVDADYAHRLLYHGELFTGEAEEFVAGRRLSLTTYREGIKDGPYRQWYASGVLQAEGVMRTGRLAGEARRWHENGVLAQRLVQSEDGRFSLQAFEWDENGAPTRTWDRDKA